MNYIFDNAVEGPSAQRFGSIEAIYDERTVRCLERTGVARGWRCLEVGAGGGSIADWLADRVGDKGSVLVTDIDPRFLTRAHRGVEVRRHDIGADPLPADTFDLIHARLVLIHVPEPVAVLRKMVAALKPGGWLVVEDFDPALVPRALPCRNESDAALTEKVFAAIRVLMAGRGLDVDFARELYRHFSAIGLSETGMEAHMAVRPGGSAGARLDRANIVQVRAEAISRGLLSADDVDRMLALLDVGQFAVMSPVMFSAWGRRHIA